MLVLAGSIPVNPLTKSEVPTVHKEQALVAFNQICFELDLELERLGSFRELDQLIEAIVGFADTETQNRWIEVVEATGTPLEAPDRPYQLGLLIEAFRSGVMNYRLKEGEAKFDKLTGSNRA